MKTIYPVNKENEMKKTQKHTLTLITLFFAALMTFTSCQSAKKASKASADDYDSDSNSGTQITKKESGSEESNDPYGIQKKKKNPIQDFFTFGNKDDYIRYDTTTVFAKELTGRLNEKDADIYLRTDDFMAGFGSYYLASYYIVQFDDANKEILAKAVENYLDDFENKRLNRKGKKTEKTYGKINYRLDWGPISSSTPNHGKGTGYLGYEFVKGSPYFTISNYPFENEYYKVAGDATTRESQTLKYFFTKAQARQLVERTQNEYIKKVLSGTNELPAATEADEY